MNYRRPRRHPSVRVPPSVTTGPPRETSFRVVVLLLGTSRSPFVSPLPSTRSTRRNFSAGNNCVCMCACARTTCAICENVWFHLLRVCLSFSPLAYTLSKRCSSGGCTCSNATVSPFDSVGRMKSQQKDRRKVSGRFYLRSLHQFPPIFLHFIFCLATHTRASGRAVG